jgi:MSHA biogenesis protein MshJ
MTADRLTDWWSRRQPRERVMGILATALLLGLAVDTLLLRPLRAQTAAAKRQLASARSELATLQKVVEERDRAGSEQLHAREADLQSRLTAAESEIHRAQVDLVAPQEMARQLSAILKRFPQLRVVGMESQPSAPVDHGQSKDGKPVTPEALRSMLFEHGLELTVEGRYLDLIAYLQQLEHTPHRIYWRELEMKVNPQGVPVTRIRFFTLSRGPAWLSL